MARCEFGAGDIALHGESRRPRDTGEASHGQVAQLEVVQLRLQMLVTRGEPAAHLAQDRSLAHQRTRRDVWHFLRGEEDDGGESGRLTERQTLHMHNAAAEVTVATMEQ